VNAGSSHREGLTHAHERVVDGRVAVGGELPHRVADDTGALDVGPIVDQIGLVHGVDDAAVDGLQPVAHIGQGAPLDDAHRVINERGLHFVLNGLRGDLLAVEFLHVWWLL